MYGTGITPDETPHVERVVDGEEYMVDVDLTPAATTLVEALAAALTTAGGMAWSDLCWLRDTPANAVRREDAVRALLGTRAVRQALTIRLTPETADQLHEQLAAAALEPDRCDQYDHGDPCRNYAAEGETSCPAHLPPN